jgi:uncharacterized protein (DUF488 family)
MQEIFTVGHSTRPLKEFVELLKSRDIIQLVDIRTVPRSRHNPQYEQKSLQESLPQIGIEYVYMKELGGLRPSAKHSVNTAWHNKSFRNYADYMQTEEFSQGIDTLIGIAANKTTVIMCAEAVPWRCHRSLVGDALIARNVQVTDMFSVTNARPHTLTSFALVDGKNVRYPGENIEQASPYG